MADTGFTANTGKLLLAGTPAHSIEKEIITVANCYPGRLVIRDTTDNGIKVSDALNPVVGWLGYEDTSTEYRKDAKTTIYAVNDHVKVWRGGPFALTATMAAGFTAVQGDYVIPWAAGTVAPAIMLPNGQLAVRFYYSKQAIEYDTGADIPSGVLVTGNAQVLPLTINASGTIDIGILSSESGGDADGFADGLAIPTANTWAIHNLVDATAANLTQGELLAEVEIKDATGTPVYYAVQTSPGWQGDGTATSVSYTTSNHTQTGYFFIPVASCGIKPVGYALESVSASTSATQDIDVENLL